MLAKHPSTVAIFGRESALAIPSRARPRLPSRADLAAPAPACSPSRAPLPGPLLVLQQIGLGVDCSAARELFLDDGEPPEMAEPRGEWALVRFSCKTGRGSVTVTLSVVHNSYGPSRNLVIGKVVFLGLHSPAPPREFAVYVNGVRTANSTGRTQGYRRSRAVVAAQVAGLSLAVGKEFELKVGMS